MPFSGTYFDLTEGHVDPLAAGYSGGQNILNDKYNQTFTLVEEQKERVNTYLAELNETLESVAMPSGWQQTLRDVVISDIQGIDHLSVTAPGTPSLEGFDEVIFPLAPVLKSAPSVDLNYDKPTKPLDVNPVLGYNETPYNSDMWYDLFTKVHDGVLNGGTALSADAEDAAYSRAKNRQRTEHEEAYAKALAEIKVKGIKFPQLAVKAIEAKFAASVARDRTDLLSDIMLKQAQLANDNTRFLIERGADLEKILRDFHVKNQTLTLEAKKAAARLILDNYAEKNKAYIAQWQGIAEELRAKVAAVEVVVAENKVLGEAYKIATDGAIAKTNQIAKERDSLVEGYKGEVSAYESKVRAQTAWYNALTENQKAKLEKNRLELQKAVEEVKATLDSNVSLNNLREKILEAMANIAAQVMASALNAVNTSIGHSTSASESRNESWSHSGSGAESHTFDETTT